MKTKLIGGPADGQWLMIDEPAAATGTTRARTILLVTCDLASRSDAGMRAHKYLVAGDRGIYFGWAQARPAKLPAHRKY